MTSLKCESKPECFYRFEETFPLPDSRSEKYELVDDDHPKLTTFLCKVNTMCDSQLLTLPNNYKFVIHIRSSGHIDGYLFGHVCGKPFRSSNEFVPHLRFLLGDDNVCSCLLCNP